MRAIFTRTSAAWVQQEEGLEISTAYAHKNPMFRKANGDFLTKKLRYQLDRPQRIRESCTKRKANLLNNEVPEAVKRKLRNAKSGRQARKRKFRSYTEMRKDREEFRKLLVSLIMAKETEDSNDKTFPNIKERELLRYSYYIQHGIDTVHVAQMDKRVYNRIISLVPTRLLKYNVLINTNMMEVKSEYEFAVKKAVIDFVLGGSLKETYKISENSNEERRGLKDAGIKYTHKIREHRLSIRRNLCTINPVLAQMLEMWQSHYMKKHFISTEELSQHEKSFDLAEFTNIVSQQIDEMRDILHKKWYDFIHSTLNRAIKNRWIPDAAKKKSNRRFFDCIASLMTQNLQDIAIRSLVKFTDFMCDVSKSNPGIRLHILLEDEDRLEFSPTFNKIQSELIRMIDNIVNAIQMFPRIECRFPHILASSAASMTYLKPIIPPQFIDDCRYTIFEMLEEQRIGPELRLQDFDEYMNLMNGNDASAIYKFMDASQDFGKYCELINNYDDIENEIAMNVWGVVTMGLYEFHREGLIETLESLAKFMQKELLQRMVSDQQADVARLQAEYEAISQRSLTVPKNTAELMESKAYVQKMEEQVIPEMENRLRINLDHFLWLMDHTIYTPLEIKQNSMTFQWYLKMPSVFKENQKIIEDKTVEYQEWLRKRIEQFRRDLDVYWEQLLDYENWGDIAMISKYKKKANILDNRLTAAMEKIERINEEESSYGWKLSEYPLRKKTHGKLLPYKKLFDAGQDFIEKRDLWLCSQVGSFDPNDIATDIDAIYEVILTLEQTFEEHPQSKKLSEDIKVIIDDFKLNMPIIQTLGNPGMKLRHWEQISEMVGFPIKVSPELTLEKIIEFGLEDYLARFVVISESATKENNLELAMSKMVIEWQGISFVINAYRDTGTYILSSVEDIQTLLDDHIIKTQTMKSSPYIKPFESEILAWETKLVLLQDILDDWLRVQATWMYLEPIFSSPDIQQQMPEEGRRFSAVDKIWKDLMKQVHADSAVMVVVEIDKMSEKLKKAFNLLEIIQKGLNTYLEKKRLYFPRFFFLSNDGLLEILAETKDPTCVQSHLRKCFAGISSLSFNESLDVTTMKSHQGEEISLIEAISTAKARGQVEKWLLELEINMKKSIRSQILLSFEAYTTEKEQDWLLKWPGQCVHAISMTYWTEQVTNALNSSEIKTSLTMLLEKLNNFISVLIAMLVGDLRSQIKLTIQGLIVIEINCRDIVAELIGKNITSAADFDWLSHLRYHLEGENLKTKMINCNLSYGYEYLGNTKRLVITPLTERCFRSIYSALHFHLGCSIEGTASVGKTETIKELAKAVAKQNVIFNCSNGLDYLALGKFFKGLSACGAWVCFNEFNRIDADVLSVVAQQILTIHRSISVGATSCLFDGVQLQMDATCAMFITMSSNANNGKTIPENLKTFFRPISMMVPDFKRICEIELLSVGFCDAKSMATKLVTTFRLCADLLSGQPHYDFGMRALKTVLRLSKMRKLQSFDDYESREDAIVMRAINDVNLGKLINDDVPIYQSILSDVFPGTQLLQSPDDSFAEAVKKACQIGNVQCTEYFMEKIQQLYTLLRIRPGLMIIGEPFGGKTTICRMLAKALEQKAQLEGDSNFNVMMAVINPKSLTIGQLHGQFDASHEWHDGILAVRYRKFAQSVSNDRKWLIFDGPIDSHWIENMNTVLDDNKKLCLMSGEIIYLKECINLIFEPMDLDAASPSTVSRCGIVYMNAESLGWEPIFYSWVNTLPAAIQDVNKQEITSLVLRFCPILLWFIRNGDAVEMLQTFNSNLIISLLNIFDCFLDEYNDDKYITTLSELDIRAQLEGIFFFSCVWSLGGPLNESSRERFSELFHGLSNKEFPLELYEKYQIPNQLKVTNLQKPYIFAIPKTGNIFDYRFIKEGKGKWKQWSDEIALSPPLARDIPVNQIIITTVETVRICALLDLLIRHGKPVLLVGPTATGKSIYAMDYLTKKMDLELYTALPMNFSAHSHANETQDIIMAKLDKRRKGVFGPPLGKKCVIFIDDLSMPLHEPFGAQSSVELMRMLLDHWMWYDRKDNVPYKLIDLQLVSAMGPPKVTGNSVTSRFTRHFNTMAIDEFSNDVLKSIFSKIVLWHLDARGFSKEFDPCIDEIVLGTLYIYTEVKKTLKPIPTKFHYIFNVRDFSRVIQGVLLSVPEATEGIDAMRRLWAHEILRVYGDRLVDVNDRQWLFEAIWRATENELHTTVDDLFCRFIEPNRQLQENDFCKLMYCDFTNPKADTRNYLEVQDLEELRYVVESYLVEFNNMTKRPMNLVLFRYAVEHLSRICRVFKQPRSHLLLVGIGGSGRQSYIRLAAHIVDYEVFQIELNRQYGMREWQNDLKTMLNKVSSSESHAVFLFTDTQIQNEKCLQDIGDLLSTGEISSLFSPDEKLEIIEKMSQIDKQRDKTLQTNGTPTALYNFYLTVIREQLHVTLCMTPVGDSFRTNVRKYPSIINCCTIDWLQSWPPDARLTVANRFLADANLTQIEKQGIIEMSMEFHTSTEILMEEFYTRYRRRNYVASISFLELIYIFKDKLKERKIDVLYRKERYLTALKQLEMAAVQTVELQRRIEELEPQLKTAAERVAKSSADVQTALEVAEEHREQVKQDENVAAEHSATATELSDSCASIMADVMPLIHEAEAALNALAPADITGIRTMKNPPVSVKIVMEAICILKDVKPDKISAGAGSSDEYWGPAKKLLGDPKFVENLLAFEKEAIPVPILKKLQDKIICNENFDPDKVKLASIATESLCKWVIAILQYEKAAKMVAPKRIALKEAEEIRDASVSQLNIKLEELRIYEENLADLQKEYNSEKDHFEYLKTTHDDCSKKLQRATEIISCLGGEKERWSLAAEQMEECYKTLTGDILISSGIIAYLSPFTYDLRMKQIEQWIAKCNEIGIPSNSDFHLENVLGNPAEIRSWGIFGLPNEDFSLQSAIIIKNARRWPLMIDPQGNANKWVKNMEKANRLCVIRFSQPDYTRVLENAMQYGLPVLLENVGEVMEPLLDCVLLKQIFKQSGSMCVKLGDAVVEYNDAFRFYVTTKLRNPNYSPELAVKVNILNFVATFDGLQELVLTVTVARERPDLEAEKTQLIIQGADNKKLMFDMEEKILESLSYDGNILEEESIVQTISTSKQQTNEINEKQAVADVTEKQVDAARLAYTPIAIHCTVLYFTIADLEIIDEMYQYNLAWFLGLFTAAIDNTDKVDDVQQRIRDLLKYFTHNLYVNICRSLFEKDKLLFSLMLAKNIWCSKGQIDQDEWLYFLTMEDTSAEESPFNWISQHSWNKLKKLTDFPAYSGLIEEISANEQSWKDYIYLSDNPNAQLPPPFATSLDHFQKLLVLRCFQSDRLKPAIQQFIQEVMGTDFVEPPQFDLRESYADANCCIPLMFILAPGTEPMAELLRFADEQGFSKNRMLCLSMGQGQGPIAARNIDDGVKNGSWVILQNCHMAKSWMPTLELIFENIAPDATHPDFRLWLTSEPSRHFPKSILQSCIKMIWEQPQSLRPHLMRSYVMPPICSANWFNSSARHQPIQFKRLVYSLCFFHAAVRERAHFGAIGWSIPYEFNDSDLKIAINNMELILNECDEVNYKALHYLTANCIYGGRVSSEWDQRVLEQMLSQFTRRSVIDNTDHVQFGECELYVCPHDEEYDDLLRHIRNLPLNAPPAIFGLHTNASIRKNAVETDYMLNSILKLEDLNKKKVDNVNQSENIIDRVKNIVRRLPSPFAVEECAKKHPSYLQASFDLILIQEMRRYNTLSVYIKSTAQAVFDAVQGNLLMSTETESISNALANDQIPQLWLDKSYPSLKPLGSYIIDLERRLNFIQSWHDNGLPVITWLPGFYSTQSFLTAIQQQYFRKHGVPIDLLTFDYTVTTENAINTLLPNGQEEVFIDGLYLEGAQWCKDKQCLIESEKRALYCEMPIIRIQSLKRDEVQTRHAYECPLYKTARRHGSIDTAGHHSNFVISIPLNCSPGSDIGHWIRRGCALLCQLSS